MNVFRAVGTRITGRIASVINAGQHLYRACNVRTSFVQCDLCGHICTLYTRASLPEESVVLLLLGKFLSRTGSGTCSGSWRPPKASANSTFPHYPVLLMYLLTRRLTEFGSRLSSRDFIEVRSENLRTPGGHRLWLRHCLLKPRSPYIVWLVRLISVLRSLHLLSSHMDLNI